MQRNTSVKLEIRTKRIVYCIKFVQGWHLWDVIICQSHSAHESFSHFFSKVKTNYIYWKFKKKYPCVISQAKKTKYCNFEYLFFLRFKCWSRDILTCKTMCISFFFYKWQKNISFVKIFSGRNWHSLCPLLSQTI